MRIISCNDVANLLAYYLEITAVVIVCVYACVCERPCVCMYVHVRMCVCVRMCICVRAYGS